MTEKHLAAVSPAETEVLRIVWGLGKATVQEVLENLPSERDIAYATVQTLLRRLEKKGYLRHRNQSRAHVFEPAVESDKVIQRSVSDFLERLFGGDALGLMQYLAQHGEVSEADIERLKSLIEEKKDDSSVDI
jgi:BlaI family penicillinase repressor